MVKVVLLSCHVTHGVPSLFRKTSHTLHSMAKMAKMGFEALSQLKPFITAEKTLGRGETF